MEQIDNIAVEEATKHDEEQAAEWQLLAFDTMDASTQINRSFRALLAGFEWRKIGSYE